MGDPGGGSDFAGFYNHLGIPIAEWGFGGAGGVYHSQYDDYTWMTKFGDPGFRVSRRRRRASVRRWCCASRTPTSCRTTTWSSRGRCVGISRRSTSPWPITAGACRRRRCGGAIDHLEREGSSFALARDSVLATTPSNATLERTNQALMHVERALTRPEGLRTRPWFRNLIYVADENNGYANMALPSVNEAIRTNDEQLTKAEVDDLAARFERAAQAVADARESLRPRSP